VSRAARSRRGKERGVLIVALMAGIAIMLILSTVAVQSWSDVVRRDNEAEMIFRAQDLVRALKRYQAEKGKLPVELKELMEPGQRGQYFLRQLWKDPLVKGGKWQLLYVNPAGGLLDPTVPSTVPGAPGQTPGSSSDLLNPTDNGQTPGSPFGTTPGAPLGTTPGLGTAGGDKTAAGGEVTGLPIAGVKSRCKDRPFRKYNDKDSYKDWVFSIFDLDPRGPQQSQAVPQTPQNQQNQQNQSPNSPTFPPTDPK
jgi:type II secretory pathway pseudopilin PulG